MNLYDVEGRKRFQKMNTERSGVMDERRTTNHECELMKAV